MNDKNYKFESKAALYIHIPFCANKCPYCAFYSEPIKNHNPELLVDALIAEMSRYDFSKNFSTAYIGGGSPSCLPGEQLLRLVNKVKSCCFEIEEFTIEANPGQVESSTLLQLRKAGVNRLSIGAQSFRKEQLQFLGRKHSVEDIGRAVSLGQQSGFENISLDLIFAIPGSTLEFWQFSLKSAISLGVQHISAYSLTYEQNTPLKKAVDAEIILPLDEETDRQMYESAINQLGRSGFNQYEISNFAKPGFECKHNLTYWANRPYVGIGPAASSSWQGTRTANIADINGYIEAINKGQSAVVESDAINPTDFACETAVLNLRRMLGINLEEFKNQTGFDALELFAETISRYETLGLMEKGDDSLFLTRHAIPIADSILCDFSSV